MTKPTKAEIDSATPEQLTEWVAVYCMRYYTSMNFEGEKQFIEMLNERNGQVVSGWQPHLPTDKGKAQAIELAEKYDFIISFKDAIVFPTAKGMEDEAYIEKSWQTAVLKACLYSVIGE